MPRRGSDLACAVWFALMVIASRAAAQQAALPPEHATHLSQQLENRVGDLISIPFQFNFNSGGAFGAQTVFELRVQPLIPIHLTPHWNLLSRTIVPFLSIPTVDGGHSSGLDDIEEELFISPAKHRGFVWGVGPRVRFPTATIAGIATGSWAAGPVGVASWVGGSWVVGALVNVDYTFAHSGDQASFGILRVQPFINYNLGRGWSLLTTPMIASRWSGDDDARWNVPVGGGIAWTTKIEAQPISLSVQYYYNVVHPDASTSNLLRFVVVFLFPR